MSPAELRQLITDRPPLFRRIVEFNCHLARTADVSHFGLDGHALAWGRLRTSRRAERRLSRWLIQSRNLSSEGFWEFQVESRRLALLSGGSLQKLIHFIGAAIYRTEITQSIDRRIVDQVKQSAGEDAYTFAIKRAQFVMKSWSPTPAAGSFATDPQQQILIAGKQAVEACLAGEDLKLIQRVNLKLPPAYALEVPSQRDASFEDRWAVVKRILVTEVDPEFRTCFN